MKCPCRNNFLRKLQFCTLNLFLVEQPSNNLISFMRAYFPTFALPLSINLTMYIITQLGCHPDIVNF